MGKMQEALKKAEEVRARGADGSAGPQARGPAVVAGTATSFALTSGGRGVEVDPRVVVLSQPQSAQAAQFRKVRDAVLAISPQQPLKVLVVASALAGEGKSVTAVNLACALAEDPERRVVVVDADLKSPSVHRLLGIDNQRGLADYLGGGTMVEMVIQRSRMPNLWALPSGRVPPNSAELLGGKRMDDLLSRLRRDYDHVVFDATSVVQSPDAAVLAPRADGSILVVRMEKTPRHSARQALELLKKAKANVVGTVLAG